MWALWSECCLVPTGGDHLQRTDRDEATGAASGYAEGAAQAATVFDFPAAGQVDPSCPQDGVAAGSDLEPVFELEARDGSVGFACAVVGKGDWDRLTDGL